MIMSHCFLPENNILKFIESLSRKGAVYYSAVIDKKKHLVRYGQKPEFTPDFTGIRTPENMKHFFLPSREAVARFPVDIDRRAREPLYLIGLKGCDLHGLDVYDRVFEKWEPMDPLYKEKRTNAVIISADCPEPAPTCFCNLVGGKPYCEAMCDINITQLKNGLLFDVKTDRGEAIVSDNQGLFTAAQPEHEAQRDDARRRATQHLEEINPTGLKENLPLLVEKAPAAAIRKARDACVECFACLHICPTCYCFLLADHQKGSDVERARIWDACYYAAYARVGGGANPRSAIDERFWNRFKCKFSYFPHYEKRWACSGCGRCFSGCSAKIDIREVVRAL
jgi:sulfhydrogenase subunit beta (sulfur reductase)